MVDSITLSVARDKSLVSNSLEKKLGYHATYIELTTNHIKIEIGKLITLRPC
jgi:hypothetical protein